MKKTSVRLGERAYDIHIGRGLVRDCGRIISTLAAGSDAVVITNKCLSGLYKKTLKRSLGAASITSYFETVPDSEKAKSSSVAVDLMNRISSYDRAKEIFIIAFGGGVIGDLAGFVAAVYKRGVPYIQIPTTLLAQVDSAIGGKVAIDLPVAKNLVGAFYQPKAVISDISLLGSLPKRQIKSGLAEIIKYGVIADRRLFEFLEKNYDKVLALDGDALEYVIFRSSRIKASIVEKDEFDKNGIRAVLNYGHTIGHAIESASGYSGRFSHGEAVAIGMAAASSISVKLGMLKKTEARRIEGLLNNVGLPTRAAGLKVRRVYEAHLHDKKFTRGKNRFILLSGIGSSSVVEGVPERIVKNVLMERLKERRGLYASYLASF